MLLRFPNDSEGTLAPNPQLPLVVEPGDTDDLEGLLAWIENERPMLEDKLIHHGAILFRGFAVRTAENFEAIARTVEPELSRAHEFDGPDPRRWWTDFVCEALDRTVTVNEQLLTLHNENSFLLRHPSKVMFCCLEPPARGGETPIVDCREVLRSIPRAVLSRFRGRYLLSPITLPFETVVANCGTDDRAEIEQVCREHGVEEVSWTPEGNLTIVSRIPALIRHPVSGEAIWFNRAHGAYSASWAVEKALCAGYVKSSRMSADRFLDLVKFVYWLWRRRVLYGYWTAPGVGLRYDDDSPLSVRDQIRVTRAYWRNAVVLKWQQGDVMVLDNRLVAHGRMPHAGKRFVLFAMSRPSFAEAYPA